MGRVKAAAITLVAAIALVAACQSPEDPFTSGPAHATVTGLVTAPGGHPITAVGVRIACGSGGPAVVAPTDSAGRYAANLETGSLPVGSGNGRLPCRFEEPTGGTARARVDTTVGFVRGPVLVALQFVDLHEQ